MLSVNTDNMRTAFIKMRDINITNIPLNPFDLITTNRWQLCTYNLFEQIIGMTSSEIRHQFSPRAFTFYSFSHDTYYLIYNSDLDTEHIQFNLAHEIGHIFYGHVSPDMPVTGKKDGNKRERDIMADQFARFVLNKN